MAHGRSFLQQTLVSIDCIGRGLSVEVRGVDPKEVDTKSWKKMTINCPCRR